MWWDPIVDRGEVRFVVRAATKRWGDVIDGVCSRLLADVADASVALQDAGSESFPVPWQRFASVSGHARIVLLRASDR